MSTTSSAPTRRAWTTSSGCSSPRRSGPVSRPVSRSCPDRSTAYSAGHLRPTPPSPTACTKVVVPDKQGRISIPPVLREWASLEREVTVIGAMDRIEIWDSTRWAEFLASEEEPFADMSDEVMPGLY